MFMGEVFVIKFGVETIQSIRAAFRGKYYLSFTPREVKILDFVQNLFFLYY